MKLDALIHLFRTETADLSDPPLVSDAALLTYIDDAQTMFCRLTYGIEAIRGREITLRNMQTWYRLPDDTLDLRSATLDGRTIRIVPAERMDSYGVVVGDSNSGTPELLVSGLEKNQLMAYPTPNADCEGKKIHLSVFRLPKPITCKHDELEVAGHHHRHLMLWMKHLAYGNQDSDLYDSNQSSEFEKKFYAYCAQAKAEQNRAYHPAGCVAYGGL